MPLYDFFCPKCQKTEEKYCTRSQSMVQCSCGEDMQRLLTAPGWFDVRGTNAKNGYSIGPERRNEDAV